MLALIAGTGDLPTALVAALPDRPLVCALDGFAPQVTPDVTFRLERLGGFLNDLQRRGVTRICLAGAIRRPALRLRSLDLATIPLIPTILRAVRRGDDGALRAFMAVLENRGFAIVAAHDIAPALLPPPGIETRHGPKDRHRRDAKSGEHQLAVMGGADLGQACLVRDGRTLATEDDAGTDAMLLRAAASDDGGALTTGRPPLSARGAILFKGPKPAQDRRADLPVIGLRTAMNAAAAGLDGLVIEAGGVMVLDRAAVVAHLDAHGLFLWVRPKGSL